MAALIVFGPSTCPSHALAFWDREEGAGKSWGAGLPVIDIVIIDKFLLPLLIMPAGGRGEGGEKQ